MRVKKSIQRDAVSKRFCKVNGFERARTSLAPTSSREAKTGRDARGYRRLFWRAA